jgi:hypothetical protein
MVVSFAAGGTADVVARILAERMRTSMGQPIIVENIGGANGTIGIGRVARAAPDGYTLSMGSWTTHVVNGAIYPLQYDTLRDFEPISLISTQPALVVAKKAMPANDLSRPSRNQKGWAQDSQQPRSYGLILADPPIHGRPNLPADAGASEENPMGSSLLRHADHGTRHPDAPANSWHFLSRVRLSGTKVGGLNFPMILHALSADVASACVLLVDLPAWRGRERSTCAPCRCGFWQPPGPTDRACRRARASQGQALRVAAKTRPALTGLARGGCAIWRSGRKNARGAGRTKEWTQQNRKTPSTEIVHLCYAQTCRHVLHGF